MVTEGVKGRILIVDDEPHFGELLARYLTPEGFECTSVMSGEEAIQALEGADFNLVISDIMMPGMSGIDLLNIIRRMKPHVAVLMVTAVDDPDTGAMAVELGASGYVIKPFTRNRILIDVASALHRQRETLKAQESEMSEQEGPAARIIKAGVPTDHILQGIRSGMEDSELMERFDLSAMDLHGAVNRLVSKGKLVQSELDERASLSAHTVAVDVTQTRPDDTEPRKPVISAAEAIRCIKDGMDDLALMKKFGISARGLRSLYKKLLDSRLLTSEDCYGPSPLAPELVPDDHERGIPKRYLAISTAIYEPEHPEVIGMLRDITERGVGIGGIQAKVGEVKTFVIPTGKFVQGDDIRFEAACVWADTPGGEGTAGFQIRSISEESLKTFRELIRVLSLCPCSVTVRRET